jgi:hypothetical protein
MNLEKGQKIETTDRPVTFSLIPHHTLLPLQQVGRSETTSWEFAGTTTRHMLLVETIIKSSQRLAFL